MAHHPSPIQISILIVSWNTANLLTACLRSLETEIAAFAPGSVETLVLDNNSHDGSAEIVRRHFPWVDLYENQSNLGFAAANNQLLAICKGRYIWLLNPDTLLKPGALHTLVAFLQTHAQSAVAGSCLLNPDGTLQSSCFPEPTLGRELWRLFHLDRLYPLATYPIWNWSRKTSHPVDIVQGASMLVRRCVLEEVGPFDTTYFMYSEEVDLCQRIRHAGWQIHWVPTSQIIHYGGQSTRQTATPMFLQLYRSKVRYFQKHHGQHTALLYKVILLIAALARLSLLPLTALQSRPQRQQNQALAAQYLRLVLAVHSL